MQQQSTGTKPQNKDDYNYSPDADDEEGGVPFPYPDETTVEAVLLTWQQLLLLLPSL